MANVYLCYNGGDLRDRGHVRSHFPSDEELHDEPEDAVGDVGQGTRLVAPKQPRDGPGRPRSDLVRPKCSIPEQRFEWRKFFERPRLR